MIPKWIVSPAVKRSQINRDFSVKYKHEIGATRHGYDVLPWRRRIANIATQYLRPCSGGIGLFRMRNRRAQLFSVFVTSVVDTFCNCVSDYLLAGCPADASSMYRELASDDEAEAVS